MKTTAAERLLHRWFVQYNPMYLVSAALVLGGMTLVSRGLGGADALRGSLSVAAVAEGYGLALIGGAALLTRIGLLRPGVMLALLAVIYQGDLTLHTETSVQLGRVGALASAAWLALFGVKLHALARAVRIHLPTRVWATASLGAFGVAVAPYFLPHLGSGAGGVAIALWLYSLASLAPARGITSAVPLDDWGHTVLRRAVRASWILWAGLVAMHVLIWWSTHRFELAPLAAIVPLLAVRYVRSELRVWTVVAGTGAVIFGIAPGAFAGTAVMVAIALVQRSFARLPVEPIADEAQSSRDDSPYRAGPPAAPQHAQQSFAPPSREAQLRFWTGALVATHAACWTAAWTSGPLPPHSLVLDAVFAVALLAFAWRQRAPVALVPPTLGGVHAALAAGLVPVPRTLVGWGATSVAVGFTLLVLSLGLSYALQRRAAHPKRREGCVA